MAIECLVLQLLSIMYAVECWLHYGFMIYRVVFTLCHDLFLLLYEKSTFCNCCRVNYVLLSGLLLVKILLSELLSGNLDVKMLAPIASCMNSNGILWVPLELKRVVFFTLVFYKIMLI